LGQVEGGLAGQIRRIQGHGHAERAVADGAGSGLLPTRGRIGSQGRRGREQQHGPATRTIAPGTADCNQGIGIDLAGSAQRRPFAAVMGRFAAAIGQSLVFTLIFAHRAFPARLWKKGSTMSSQHIQASLPGLMPMHQAGSLRAVALQRLNRIGSAIWDALEAVGQERSARELTALARKYEHTNPTLARQLRSYVRGGSSY